MAGTPKIGQLTTKSSSSAPGPVERQRFRAQAPSVSNILARLPREESDWLMPHLHRVLLHRGQIVLDVGSRIGCLGFPLAGLIGLLAVVDDGRTLVLAATGREGFLGVPALLGDEVASLRAVVLIEGEAFNLGREQLPRILPATPYFAAALHRYCGDHLEQVVQNGACHAPHSVPQRVASWLLMARDRSDSDSLPFTHQVFSELLGCRRSSVTEALLRLEDAGVIHEGRGHISISDHAGLAGQACECYAPLRDRLTPG